MPAAWTAIVLAGGRSSRLGTDKVQAELDDRRLIDHVLTAIPPDVDVIVVGPDPRATSRQYSVTREPEPGSGPVAGIAAGLALATTPLVAVVATDMPFAGPLLPALVTQLAAAGPAVDAVIPVDVMGHEQPLAGAYRVSGLARALAELGPPEGRSVRSLLERLRIEPRAVASSTALLDVDTPDDLEAARRSVPSSADASAPQGGGAMDEWVAAVSSALEIEQVVDLDTILDVARDAAHAVARPAAPVTTFLLGAAVAGGADPKEAAATIAALAQGWPAAQ